MSEGRREGRKGREREGKTEGRREGGKEELFGLSRLIFFMFLF